MKYFWHSIKREVRMLTSSPTPLIIMVLVPLGCAIFFISLLSEGLPLKVPTSVVDLDH